MPQMSKQAYQNLMQASRKYATVTYSVRVPNKPRIYFKSRQALLAYKKSIASPSSTAPYTTSSSPL